MTLRTDSRNDSMSSDVLFRAWVQAMHDHFAAAGLVQTSDTGQVNLATVVRPAISSSAGYEIWRFADTDQAAAPIYFKIEYGANTTAISSPSVWVTVGTGSDGAGTITATGWPSGVITTRKQLSVSATGAASGVTQTSYFDYLADGSGFILALWPGSTAALGGYGFGIERFRDPDGTPSEDGVNVFFIAGTSSTGSAGQEGRFYAAGATQPTTPAGPLTPAGTVGPANSSALFGTVLRPYPVFTGCKPRLGGPSQLLMAIGAGDLAVGVTFSMDHYGTSRTWLSLGASGSANGWGSLSSGLIVPVIRGD